MYAERYGRTGIRPGALGVAIALNGAVMAALIFSTPEVRRTIDTVLTTTNVPIPKDPPPIPETKPETKVRPDQKTFDLPPPDRPQTTDQVAPKGNDFTLPLGPSGLDGGVTGGTGTILPPYDPPVHVPLLVGAQPDPRFARQFQPDYPPGERRAGNEGRVTVRVLVGVDGRVKQVELVRAASDAFFAATRRQALEKWRFKPATRDGIPQEEWRVMNVSFVLNDEA